MNRPLSLAFLLTLMGAFIAGVCYVFYTIGLNLLATILICTVSFSISTYLLLQRNVFKRLEIVLKKISPTKKPLISKNTISNLERNVQSIERLRKKEIKVLKDRERFRREFIGNVSHELKTPIFNVQGYLLTLLDGAADDPEIMEKYLKRANKSIERIISIIKDLDFITKLESGVLDVKLKPFDVYALVVDVLEQLEDSANENNVTLRLKKNIDPPLMVNGDNKRIEQVLINLVQNAIKYARQPNSYVEIDFLERPRNIDIIINDNGLGIPKSDLPRIFERFYRVDKSRTREAGGSGLGLAIVKHIIEGHKQEIRVESTEGVGSTFIFSLEKN